MEEKTETGGGTGAGEEMVVVYSLLPQCLKYSKAGLSILVKTETGEVYGGGLNFAEGSTKLVSYTKVGGLEGDVKKIVVGYKHCAALTHDGRLMAWEHKSYPVVDAADSIGLRRYNSGASCTGCTGGCRYMWGLAYCGRCDMYQPGRGGAGYDDNEYSDGDDDNDNDDDDDDDDDNDDDDDDDDDDYEPIIISRKERTLLCRDCCQPHTTKTITTWDLVEDKCMDVSVAFCASCEQYLLVNDWYCSAMNMNYSENNSVRTILRTNDERIKDVAFFGDDICMLFEDNNLYIQEPNSKDKYKIDFQPDKNSPSGEMVGMYGGGGGVNGQLYVKYKDGSLLKCSIRVNDGVTTGVLRDMKLASAVKKVCCGVHCTAVLLNDGSVWFITPDCTTQRLVHKSGLSLFTDIAVIANTDVYLVQAPTGTTGDGAEIEFTFSSAHSQEVVVEFYELALNTVFKEMVPPTPRTEDSSNIPARTLPLQNLPLPSPNNSQLYGKSHLADMTIKLADEELPAHSVVLSGSSAHFQKTFNADNTPPKVLDVSHYNPQAYKYLLQYFYQIQPDDLDAEGFTHLRQIAASYEETQLVEAATPKIKSLLCENNVERIFTLSKRYDFQDLVAECKTIMRSPTFVEKLLEAHQQNLTTSEDLTGK